jgi:hypothetical protein
MTRRHESITLPADQDVAIGQGGVAYLPDIKRRLAPRQWTMAYLRGLLRPAARQNSWQIGRDQ